MASEFWMTPGTGIQQDRAPKSVRWNIAVSIKECKIMERAHHLRPKDSVSLRPHSLFKVIQISFA